MPQEFDSLELMLEHIAGAAHEHERVSLGLVVETIGSRSFGPLLLMVGVVLASPLSGIPGMPTMMSLMVLLIAVQLLFGGKNFWLPHWLLARSVAQRRVSQALHWSMPVARTIDRFSRPRLGVFVSGAATYVVALMCVVIAAGMPIMELVPFSATGAGVALTAFGLALVTRDGLLAVIAFAFTVATFGLVLHTLL